MLATIETTNLTVSQSIPLDQNPAAVYLAGLATPAGRRVMKQSLDVIADIMTAGQMDALSFPWHSLRFQHTQAIRSKLIERYPKSATANRFLSALRGVLQAAWRLEQMSSEDYTRARDVKGITGETVPAGRELAPGELSALMSACMDDPSPGGCRDASIVALMYAAGLRRDEVIRLDLESYDQDAGRLLVHGKRNKERNAYITNGAVEAMQDWLIVRGAEPGPLFFPVGKGGKIRYSRLTTQAIYNMLKRRGKQAGIAKFSPHDMRRTFVSDLLEAGADIATVAKMAGHASVQTTARYDRRPEAAKQKAAGLLHVPYRRRLV